MMTRLVEKKIVSFQQFLDFIETQRKKRKTPLWYRGSTESDKPLLPGLYKHSKCRSIEDFIELENNLIARFKQRSIAFTSRPIEDQWDLMFFMQHYGVPTRLLDWTESPLIALYFSVALHIRHNIIRSRSFKKDAAVWILDPQSWNKSAINLKSFKESILTPFDANLSSYKPPVKCTEMKEEPLAVYGTYNSQRIVAQRGTFLIFGKSTKPMEDIFEKAYISEGCLIKMHIKYQAIHKIYEALSFYGITDSVVFPDLEGLAREIMREFKFGD